MARIGVDIVKISRIEKLIGRPGFYRRVFTQKEQDYFVRRGHKAETVAGSYASKEALAKVFGTGIGQLAFKDMEILRDESGRPYVALSDKGQALARERGLRGFEISISHEKDYAVAIALADQVKPSTYTRPQDLARLKDRPSQSHKGTFGKVGLIGGAEGMAGSILLSSQAALRTGSGLAYTMVPGPISEIVQIKSLENIVYCFGDQPTFTRHAIPGLRDRAAGMDALAIGPGMGRHDDLVQVVRELLDLGLATVLDADGINAAAQEPSILKGRNLIISPHKVEMARLSGKNLDEIDQDPKGLAQKIAKDYGIVVVLKGPSTIVTDGARTFINQTGNSGMATAGSGDVLTGMLASLLGQGYETYDAACLGVHIHGLAGDLASQTLGEDSLIARDIIAGIGPAIREFRKWK